MNRTLLNATILSTLMMTAAASAQAGNATVENALRSRPELSTFYQELVNTGVVEELKEGRPYTVFAPTNAAFAKLSWDQSACATSDSCRAQMTQLVRNHIVEGEKHLRDISEQQGGMMSMFSINDFHIVASEPFKGNYAIDGHPIQSENQLLGGDLYVVDHVLATKQEMAQLASVAPIAKMYVDDSGLPPRVPAGKVVTITDTTTVVPAGDNN